MMNCIGKKQIKGAVAVVIVAVTVTVTVAVTAGEVIRGMVGVVVGKLNKKKKKE